MSINCGIIGLPNVGKSTIFTALTSTSVDASNYPFCTIDSNKGMVTVPDKRLDKIYEIFDPPKKIPTAMEFVDIAGLVKGASKGEGLGNKFLANIREVNAIIHVVRCFEEKDIAHVYGNIDPKRDIEVINLELAMADLETVKNRIEKQKKLLKSQDKKIHSDAEKRINLYKKIEEELAKGIPLRKIKLNNDELKQIDDLNFLTLKDVLYICNVDEEFINKDNDYVEAVKEIAEEEGSSVLKLCGEMEAEISQLDSEEEKNEFREMLDIKEKGLDRMIKTSYKLLDLITFFTKNKKEVRAWTCKKGTKAPQAAGKIHSDFEKGFIKAEVYHYNDIKEYGNEDKLKNEGLIRVEGKDYIVKDGDIIYFKFNV